MRLSTFGSKCQRSDFFYMADKKTAVKYEQTLKEGPEPNIEILNWAHLNLPPSNHPEATT